MADDNINNSGYTYRYPRPAVTVDVVLFSLPAETLQVLLIRRKHTPFEGMWAYPGGFVEMDEDLRTAALRELQEETGLADSSMYYVEQLHAFGAPDRDPRQRTISVAYLALAPWSIIGAQRVQGADDAADARWWPVTALPELAFDHAHIMQTARRCMAESFDLRGYAFHLLPSEFTQAEYRSAYQALTDQPYGLEVFERLITAGVVAETDDLRNATGESARLYRHLSSSSQG